MVRAKVFEDNQWFTNRIVFDRDALFSSFLSDKEFVGAQLTKAEPVSYTPLDVYKRQGTGNQPMFGQFQVCIAYQFL